ncbi:radial spoke head 10 B-like isoform X4, partial [Clarias magur]
MAEDIDKTFDSDGIALTGTLSADEVEIHSEERVESSAITEIPAVQVLSDQIIQRYEGDRSGEMFHGEGVAFFKGGHVYKGGFVDGVMHGPGEYTWADGLKYEGDFKSNAPMGHGTYTWLDRSTYEGEVCNGIRHGLGTYKSSKTSTVYKGQWYKGKRHGKGTMYYNDEETSWYKGDWENNRKEGWGMRCYPSGDTYEGQWKNSVRHGEGTMKWIQLGQQYSGQWLNGVQHGNGTHTWFLRRVFGSQYPLRNEYKGEFAQGLRHGQGTFTYASGSVYYGGWKNNKKHGQGKIIFKNGCVYEGEFIDDRIAEFPTFSTISVCALVGLPSRAEESGNNATLLGPDITLNIENLLSRTPEAQRGQELRQVEFAIMRNITLLRSTYTLYSSLGNENSPDNTFLLSQIQCWRFLQDCNIHQHGLTLAQLENLINKDISPGKGPSPFSTMLLREWISYIVVAAYHIYHRDFESSSCVLAECFSKFMKQNIIPNPKNVKGHLYCHPLRAAIGKTYLNKCWEIYHTIPKVTSSAISNIMTARHLIWMFKVLHLFDQTLTTRKLLEILSLENPAIYCSSHSNLDLEVTFLEFFECLLASAEVKDTLGDRTAQENPAKASGNQEFKSNATPKLSCTEEIKPKDHIVDLAITDAYEMELNKESTCSVLVDDTQMSKQPSINTELAKEERPEEQVNWKNRIHQFFTNILFPAYEHKLVCEKEMQKEHQRQTTDNRLALEKAKANA